MPTRETPHKVGTRKFLKNVSYEPLVAAWFTQAGWQVFTPLFDHGHQTDLLVSDGPNYYRIQVKTTELGSDKREIENLWHGSDVHYVVLFAQNSNWGFVFPAFEEKKRRLKDTEGERFALNPASFMKAFHSLH